MASERSSFLPVPARSVAPTTRTSAQPRHSPTLRRKNILPTQRRYGKRSGRSQVPAPAQQLSTSRHNPTSGPVFAFSVPIRVIPKRRTATLCSSPREILSPKFHWIFFKFSAENSKKWLSAKYLFYKPMPVRHLLKLQHPLVVVQTVRVPIMVAKKDKPSSVSEAA